MWNSSTLLPRIPCQCNGYEIEYWVTEEVFVLTHARNIRFLSGVPPFWEFRFEFHFSIKFHHLTLYSTSHFPSRELKMAHELEEGDFTVEVILILADFPAVPFNICHWTDTWGAVGQSPIQESPLSNSPIIVTIVLKPGLRISIVENLESRVSMRFHSREQYRVLNLQYWV